MKENNALPIIEVAYTLALEINKIVVKFPRHQRGGLGRRLEDAVFNLLERLTKARYSQSGRKQFLLNEASGYLDNLRLSVRMSFDLGYFASKAYERLARIISELGCMLGGWQKSQKQSGGGIINEFYSGRNSVFFQSSPRLEDDKWPSCPRRVSSFLF